MLKYYFLVYKSVTCFIELLRARFDIFQMFKKADYTGAVKNVDVST